MSRAKIDGAYNQLRWVVLLLAIAVVLPTICLLWFMTAVVRNERLAVRQKLTDVYEQRLETLSRRLDEFWSARIKAIEQQAATNRPHSDIFEMIVGRDNSTDGPKICDSIIIFDSNGKLVYPLAGDEQQPAEFSEQLSKAWIVEFTGNDFAGAINLYERIAEFPADDYTYYSALLGNLRCLKMLGKIEQAAALCEKLAYGQAPVGISPSSAALIARARILLVELKGETKEGLNRADLQKLMRSAINYTAADGYGFLPMPAGTRIFLLRKALKIVEKSKWADELKPDIYRARRLLAAEELDAAVLDRYYTGTVLEYWSGFSELDRMEENSLKMVSLLRATLDTIKELDWSWAEQLKQQISTVLDSYSNSKKRPAGFGLPAHNRPAFVAFESWSDNNFRRMEVPEVIFGMYHNFGGKTYLLLQKAEEFGADFNLSGENLEDPGVSYRITDNFEKHVCGLENPQGVAFLRVPLGKFFPGWHVEVHFKDFDIFEKAAGRQTLVYMWAGLLAIAVMIAAGLLSAQVVGRQIKINKLKNDFIATVSHELKTPLASMRVLVDTLLEGNVKGQQQVTEYLQLVSKENERLSSLVDNFLTFSRMERNRQKFEMLITEPASIARAAADAVKTKFSKGQCRFEVDIQEDLPDILADHDAIVTVLVNLLDNAYKYSYDDKHIELKVFSENGSVCFRVSDNGIGLSRRSIRKIFKRFYQADRSLTRRAEGCGLGLSIAKFIVDAHKGSISVESKTGQGSTFTVRLSAMKTGSGGKDY